MKHLLAGVLAALGILCATEACRGAALGLESPTLNMSLDPASRLPTSLETRVRGSKRPWLANPVRLAVRNEVSSAKASVGNAEGAAWQRRAGLLVGSGKLAGLPLTAVQQWSSRSNALVWEIDFLGDEARAAHEVTIELPLLAEGLQVFTPTERGVMEIASYPTFQGLPYATIGWETGRSWVLPLASVLDPKSDHAITIALAADANIPHLQFDWFDGKTLRLTLAHRGMGGGLPSKLTLMLFGHAADYRAALRAYSDAFPSYFRSPLPRGRYEGTFWYHHIQDHPPLDEMARQSVRYIWSSFWFTHLGEYLPEAREWEPYTYAKWWKLGETMSDAKIQTFVQTMRTNGIGTYAYFNVTEYGGAGGKTGDTAEAARILREKFANALVKDATGNDIPTWEGAMAMNPGSGYSLWPFLEDQVRRHLARLPEVEGFVIDRLDWASQLDYAHDDGLSMIGERPAENLAVPIAEAVRGVAALSHAAGKRVFVNQFYRIEVLRDVDGVCHENDYLPALGYLTPLRPASAWHHRQPYQGDLLPFEVQLKQRLHWALFPQMIAHQFPISQQAPNPRAADFLELYAPLFDSLLGKEQVLRPHCVEVTGANDANLFVNGEGHYVVPVTSRTRFLSRPGQVTEPITATLRVPDAPKLVWAQAISADGPSYRARLSKAEGAVRITADQHSTATMLVVGEGPMPAVSDHEKERFAKLRNSLSTKAPPPHPATAQPRDLSKSPLRLRLAGAHVGAAGPLAVLINEKRVGRIAGTENRVTFDWTPTGSLEAPPEVTLIAGDEGTWFIPERIEVLVRRPDGGARRLASWQSGMPIATQSSSTRLRLPLRWSVADLPTAKADFQSRDTRSAGRWRNRVGSRGAWIPGVVGDDSPQNGFQLEILAGEAFHWLASQEKDSRLLDHPQDAAAKPTCWFQNDRLSLRLRPSDEKPYRLTLYVLDYDRDGRAEEVVLSDEFAAVSTASVTVAETAGGAYLSWQVIGAVNIELRKTAGHNTVLSGVFVDPAIEKSP